MNILYFKLWLLLYFISNVKFAINSEENSKFMVWSVIDS